jgi:hypothetical protein
VSTRPPGALRRIERDLRLLARNLKADYFAHGAWQARSRRQKRDWEAAGKADPPPHMIKEEVVRAAAQANGIRTLVETGTLHGDMIAAVAGDFDRVYSIELSRELYWLARLRFLARRRVRLVRGDSSEKIQTLLDRIDEPCVFWLDGHYGGGIMAKGKTVSPILEELSAIMAHRVRTHVVLIDDAGMFERGTGDPPSLATLAELVKTSRPASSFVVQDNIIRVTLS